MQRMEFIGSEVYYYVESIEHLVFFSNASYYENRRLIGIYAKEKVHF